MVYIDNFDLMQNRNAYSVSDLESNIDHLSKKILLNTQKLTEEFCIKHIYCVSDIDDGDEESYLFCLNHIMNRQPHLDEQKLLKIIESLNQQNR